MAIEIYNKAKVIQKDNKVYYFLKYHSKNDCICGGQYIVDNEFNTKYAIRDSRAGSWSVKAIGTLQNHKDGVIGKTKWNAPTSWIYGEIRFGNKLNIALYWAKQKPVLYESFTEEQKRNIDSCINWVEVQGGTQTVINLEDIKEKDEWKAEHEYCGTKYFIADYTDYKREYAGQLYWNLNNL